MLFRSLAGIAPEEADRIISLLEELTTEDTPAEGEVHSSNGGAKE